MTSSEGNDAADSTDDSKSRGPTLLEEVEEMMAQSLLVFLVADLRLMSATGRIETKYETLAIASDPPTRSTAAQLAGLNDDDQRSSADNSVLKHQNDGLSPAQIMAVLLIELTKTVEARRKEEERLAKQPVFRKSVAEEFKHDTFPHFEPDASGKIKLRAKEEDMNTLLKAYAEMIGQDLDAEVPHIKMRRSMMSLLKTRGGLESVPEELEREEEEQEEEELEKEQEEEELAKEQEEELEKEEEDDHGAVNEALATTERQPNAGTVDEILPALQRLRNEFDLRMSLPKTEEVRTEQKYREVTDALFRMGEMTSSLRISLSRSFGPEDREFTPKELLEFMTKAVESRNYDNLDFMADFFRPGTVSRLCAQSKSRLVWMNDWYPLKDLTYAIAVDKEKKRVLVVFRGAITRQDWSRGWESRHLRNISNPIFEHYEDKTSTIAVSSGFYDYLFRRRKDTKTVKFDEIANIAYKYGHERIGDDFSLVVTGHSLGGALSTVFGFFASTDDRFTRNGPVKVFNFGSPYVGGRRFVRAFQHQEKRKKLQLARFFNHNDIVAHLPPNFEVTKHGGKFRHVGIGIRLYSAPIGLCSFLKWHHPDVFYVKEETFVRSYWRAIRNNFILKFPLPPWRFAEMHTLNELQKRLVYGAYRSGKDFSLLCKPIDELYEMFVGTEQEPES